MLYAWQWLVHINVIHIKSMFWQFKPTFPQKLCTVKDVYKRQVQKDAEAISRLIKERITPLPQFILKPLQEDDKNLLALEVSPGRSTPYYYKADGVMEAYIRVGNESVIAPDYIVNELILKGTNQSFDTLTTDAVKKDYSFTLLEATLSLIHIFSMQFLLQTT